MSDDSILAGVLAGMADEARAFLGRIGRRFGSREVIAQAKQTLAAHERHEFELRVHGFGAADRRLLTEALAAAEAHLQRAQPAKTTERAYVTALGEAKTARARARSVLLSAYRRMRARGGDAATMAALSDIVSQTAEPGGDDRVYAQQLARLREVLAMVADEVADTGGPEADAMVAEQLDELRRLDPPDVPHSDADVIDGLIVELCRTAQFAAQSVARERGFAIAGEFRLAKLLTNPKRNA